MGILNVVSTLPLLYGVLHTCLRIAPLIKLHVLTLQLCSMGGVYVAQLGLRSLTTMNAVEIARYTRHLSMLAMACIAFRILWVIDFMTLEQHKTNEARDNTNTTTPSDPNSNTTDDDEHGLRREPNHMLNVGIQVDNSI